MFYPEWMYLDGIKEEGVRRNLEIFKEEAVKAGIIVPLGFDGPKFLFCACDWPPFFKADLQKTYDAFVAAHRRKRKASHQIFLRLQANRGKLGDFLSGQSKTLIWIWRECEPITFKQHLADNGFDVSVFDR